MVLFAFWQRLQLVPRFLSLPGRSHFDPYILWLLWLWLCLSMLLRLGMLLLRLGMLLWLCLSMLLLLRLGMLLWLCLSMLLLLRLSMFLLLLLLWLGFLLSVLCEGRNNGSERQKQDCCSETCKCFHWYCLNYRVGVRATNSCILLTVFA